MRNKVDIVRIEIDPRAGDDISETIKQAMKLSMDAGSVVEFEFNGVWLEVDAAALLMPLYKAYQTGFATD